MIYFFIFSIVIYFSYELYNFFVNKANEEEKEENLNENYLMLNEPLIN